MLIAELSAPSRSLRLAIDTAFGERVYTVKQVISIDNGVVRFIDLKGMTITLEPKDIKRVERG